MCRLGFLLSHDSVPYCDPQSLAGSSKSLKTAVSRASTPRAERNDRAPVDAAASSRSYINAICDVLDRYPDGAGKEQVMKEVMERRAEWWPDKQDDTVRRGLAVAFSTEPKSKAPRIWEWRKELVPQLDEMRGKRSTFSDEAKRLHQRKEEWPTRIAALEQQLQEAREHADNASGEYEKVQAEAAEVAALVEKMEKEIQGIDADMLQ
ncbi:hypothetical protein B0A55_10982 [Friedmanniomyces simplex]|uniref:Uncharacterized protein n=1 Tax=Friedmanniomyces simplex TaxID=329884 RepID=A0A4U0X005_9PEZI|nr:hypothetical protein B0A55_10982 [Friedmanniomyces simplex]